MKVSRMIPLFAVVILTVPVIMPYFHQGFFPTHDGEWAVVRLADMIRSLREGQFPVRWSSYLNHGYGYPLFNYAYPFPYYLGAALHLVLRTGLVDTIKIIFALSVPVSGLGMYLLTKRLWKSDDAGLLASGFYIYLPYRMVDLYVRGSIGESMALAIVPFLGWAMVGSNVVLTAILFALLIGSHNIMTVLFLPVVVAYLLVLLWHRRLTDLWKLLLGLVLGLGLAAFFWLPAILEKGFVRLSEIPIADRSLYFLNLSDLWTPKFGYGMPGTAGGFGYQLGWPHLVALLIAIGVIVWGRSRTRSWVFLLVGLLAAYLFMLFPVSGFFWSVPLFSEINYPWTILAPLGFLISLLSGVLVMRKWSFGLGVVLFFLAMGLVWPWMRPSGYVNRGDDYYATNDATTTSSSELMPIWVKKFPTARPENRVDVIGRVARVNTVYFPGWRAFSSGREVVINYDNEFGLIEVAAERASNLVLSFGDTPVRRTGNLISAASLIFLIAIVIRKKGYAN